MSRSIDTFPDAKRAKLVARLRKIEGQARGIERMIAGGRDCVDVLTQIAAMRAATDALAIELRETAALGCLLHPDDFTSPEQAIEQAVHILVHGGR